MVFCIPVLLVGSTTLGLVLGLVGDGLWDAASWGMLAPPLWLSARALLALVIA